MNFSDIRDMDRTQWLFWAVAICTTVGVVTASVVLAFFGGDLMELFHLWSDNRKKVSRKESKINSPLSGPRQRSNSFRVYGGFKISEVL